MSMFEENGGDARGAGRERRALSGCERAATILLAMGKPAASRLLKHFDPTELRDVTRAAASLGSVPTQELELVVEDFAGDFASGTHLLGNRGEAENLLNDALSTDQVAGVISDAFGAAGPTIWKAVADMPSTVVAAYLARENPVVATYTLSKLDTGAAAKIVHAFEKTLRGEIIRLLMDPPIVEPAVAELVEAALRDDLVAAAVKPSSDDQRARVAHILNSLEPEDAADVMQSLAEASPADARSLKRLLFTFNDVPRLSQRARAVLFDKLPTDAVVLSLRGMPEEFRNIALSSLASRSRRLVESELANGADVPAADIAKARKKIADAVLDMVRRGEIEIASPDEAEEA